MIKGEAPVASDGVEAVAILLPLEGVLARLGKGENLGKEARKGGGKPSSEPVDEQQWVAGWSLPRVEVGWRFAEWCWLGW